MPAANPFFLRELRRLQHRPLPVQALVVLVPSLMGAAFGLLVLLRAGRGVGGPFVPWMLALLCAPHALACLLAGAYGADRILGAEYRQGTLEGLSLLPIPAGRRLLAQCAFPAYLMCLAFAVGLPVHVLVTALGRAAPAEAHGALGAIAALGCVSFLTVLLLPPDSLSRLRELRSGAGRRAALDLELLLRGALVSLAGLQWVLWVGIGGFRSPGRAIPFFGQITPLWRVGAVCAVILVAAAVLTALGASDPVPDSAGRAPDAEPITRGEAEAGSADTVGSRAGSLGIARRAAPVRTAAAAVHYYAIVGILLGSRVSAIPGWVAALILLGPPAFLLVARWLLRGAREDPRSQREVRWAERRWDNPLLLKDLRVYTRYGAMRATSFRIGAGVAAFLALQAYLAHRTGAPLDQLLSRLAYVSLLGTLLLYTLAAVRAYNVWTQERRCGALPLLFLTPLGSVEMLRGRMHAALLYSFISAAPIWLLGLVGATWYAGQGKPFLFLSVATLAPVFWLFVVALGCVVRPQRDPPWRWPAEDWWEAGLGVLQITSFAGSALLIDRAAADRAGWQDVGVMLVVLGLNQFMCWACFRLRVRTLDLLRHGDLEIS